MKKSSTEMIALMEKNGSHIINHNYNNKGEKYTILMHIKKNANAKYDSPESTFKHFKKIMRDMRFVKESEISGVNWKEVWEYFKD